jgi:PhnB protein
MHVRPYVTFDGRCEEALEFYRGAVGAEVTAIMRFKEMPGAPPGVVTPANENKVLHSEFRIGTTTVMAADGMKQDGRAVFQGMTLAILTTDVPEAERLFASLSRGGQVTMPLEKTFFSDGFGTLTDRFGVPWMVVVSPEDA